MTREEAHELVNSLLCGTHKESTNNHYADVKLGIDKIYDSLENRSCESCRYFHQNYLCLDLGCGDIKPKEIGLKYCGNWESK